MPGTLVLIGLNSPRMFDGRVGLGVPDVDVAWAALEENEDDGFGACPSRSCLWRRDCIGVRPASARISRQAQCRSMPAPPTRKNSRRVKPSQVLPDWPGIDNIEFPLLGLNVLGHGHYRLYKNAGLFISAQAKSWRLLNRLRIAFKFDGWRFRSRLGGRFKMARVNFRRPVSCRPSRIRRARRLVVGSSTASPIIVPLTRLIAWDSVTFVVRSHSQADCALGPAEECQEIVALRPMPSAISTARMPDGQPELSADAGRDGHRIHDLLGAQAAREGVGEIDFVILVPLVRAMTTVDKCATADRPHQMPHVEAALRRNLR